MSGDTLVQNDLSAGGLRRVHIMRMGQPVDPEIWDHLVPGDSREDVTHRRYHEAEMDVWHHWMIWPVREFVNLVVPESTSPPAPPLKGRGEKRKGIPAVFWWIGYGVDGAALPMRFAIDLAATVYRLRAGSWPGAAMVRKLPKNATETVEVSHQGERAELRLVEMDWVPEGFVVVAEREVKRE